MNHRDQKKTPIRIWSYYILRTRIACAVAAKQLTQIWGRLFGERDDALILEVEDATKRLAGLHCISIWPPRAGRENDHCGRSDRNFQDLHALLSEIWRTRER
jgi:hypothetical protein